MLKVLVADDQELIRAGLVALIRAAPGFEIVGEAATGEEAITLAAMASPDVILMDVRMPGIGGIAATERILAAATTTKPKVLVLTTFDIDEYVYDALRAGASGFLLKETSPQRLLAGIRTVANGDTLLAPTATRHLIEAFTSGLGRARTPGAPGAATPPPPEGLTARETEVLVLVAHALSNQDIAERLTVSESTVKTHLNRVMVKLGLSSRAQVVAYAYEHGLITPGRPAR
ncbi:DNA-binding NarL/FixJ family response regulator [Nonomuraea thailandensis]|uniref:DNA-binding NarL/FixJ family response regulator n=1 Tax=Nonomuraea thailandensis TaxID=1188745 RepID=A0A9X2GIJ0_9ACTN|nr:response regulator transcription factor [Nonomuraea thailandensis]MCP2358189.1 DNA-binding NarL/FixJ family response regulator [Nonomuraea thailandensis]